MLTAADPLVRSSGPCAGDGRVGSWLQSGRETGREEDGSEGKTNGTWGKKI